MSSKTRDAILARERRTRGEPEPKPPVREKPVVRVPEEKPVEP